MALSNKFGAMLLTTGNKSEVAVGYATIYGDMSGGYNPVKDLYKTRICSTACRWRNANHDRVVQGPRRARSSRPAIIDKPPTRPSCARTRRTRTACRPIRSWTRS